MVAIPTPNGDIEVPDAMLRGVVQHAQWQADLTGMYFQTWGLTGDQVALPANALLEIAAVLELGMWEKLGLRDHLEVDLPTYREAQDAFAARCAQGPQAFEGDQGTELSSRVLRAWVKNFAWQGPELLGADAVVSDFDDDEFIDLLAEFCWEHRHEISKLTTPEEGAGE